MLRKINANRKGQEEMVGFVVIVMIVVVVGVVFLAFSIRKPSSTTQKQQELADISWALLSYTTNCSINTMPQSVWDLATHCNVNNPQCDNSGGKMACRVLNDTVIDALATLMGRTDITLSDKFVHAYRFKFIGEGIPNGELIIEKGNLSGNYFSYLTFIPSNNGDINVTTRFYYS
ncbi:MAG: hypothetical protein NTX24_01565 [Candidatus Pacearchaeota archaeon]|nr:hypothetical protein [Candidatus Pacearchaeota archaeon]